MKMKYYLVPITSKIIKCANTSTSVADILKSVDLELYKMEIEKIKLEYDFEDTAVEEIMLRKNESDKIAKKSTELYKVRRLPDKILLIEKEDKIYESATKLPVESVSEVYLKVFSVDCDEALKYFTDDDYSEKVFNLFENYFQNGKILEKVKNEKN